MKKTLSIFLLLSIKIAVFSQTSILEDNLMKDAEVAFLQINQLSVGMSLLSQQKQN